MSDETPTGPLVMRDLMDQQLLSSDGRRIGRVDDVEGRIDRDGGLTLIALASGPVALLGRVHPAIGRVGRRVLGSRFESRIEITEVAEPGLDVHLRGPAERYATGRSDAWLARHLIDRLPGGRRRDR
jgi:hypothetical protein